MSDQTTPCWKYSYPTRRDAERVNTQIRRQGRDEQHAYRCPDCGLWHLSKRNAVGRLNAARAGR